MRRIEVTQADIDQAVKYAFERGCAVELAMTRAYGESIGAGFHFAHTNDGRKRIWKLSDEIAYKIKMVVGDTNPQPFVILVDDEKMTAIVEHLDQARLAVEAPELVGVWV